MNAVAEQSTGQGTGLIHQPQGSNGLAIYDRVDPMTFIDTFGKVFAMTGAGGADTVAKGQLLALACLCRRQDIFQVSSTYHLIGGKLSMKSDVMLAKFRQAGGKHQWIKDGSDGFIATAIFTFEGNSTTVSYSIEDAKRADLLAGPGKKPGNWEKNPAAMLRARVVSSGVRMLAPEVLEGSYCPEELEDEPQQSVQATVTQAPSAASVVGVDNSSAEAAAATKRKRRTAAEIAADKAAEEAAITGATTIAGTTVATSQPDSEVIDAVVEPAVSTASTTTIETPTAASPDSPGSITPASLAKIGELAAMLGVDLPGLRTHLLNENPDFPEFAALSQNSAEILIDNLDQIANPKK